MPALKFPTRRHELAPAPAPNWRDAPELVELRQRLEAARDPWPDKDERRAAEQDLAALRSELDRAETVHRENVRVHAEEQHPINRLHQMLTGQPVTRPIEEFLDPSSLIALRQRYGAAAAAFAKGPLESRAVRARARADAEAVRLREARGGHELGLITVEQLAAVEVAAKDAADRALATEAAIDVRRQQGIGAARAYAEVERDAGQAAAAERWEAFRAAVQALAAGLEQCRPLNDAVQQAYVDLIAQFTPDEQRAYLSGDVPFLPLQFFAPIEENGSAYGRDYWNISLWLQSAQNAGLLDDGR